MLLKSKKLPIGMGFQVRDDKRILPYPIYWNGIERGWYDKNMALLMLVAVVGKAEKPDCGTLLYLRIFLSLGMTNEM